MKDARPSSAGVSLKVLFAAGARRAVILRRGPREHYHLIGWDLETDAFERGQWMRGVVRLSDLSADGTRLLYWAAQYHHPRSRPSAAPYYEPAPDLVRSRSKRRLPRYVREQASHSEPVQQVERFSTWTALSKPPYFTALAIWPSMGTWTGGGYFGADGSIHVAEPSINSIVSAEPPNVPIHAVQSSLMRTGRIGGMRSARFGDVESEAHQSDVALELYTAGANRIHWVDLRSKSGVTFAYDGRVYRSSASPSAAPATIVAAARLVADFNGLMFEKIPPPPSARQW